MIVFTEGNIKELFYSACHYISIGSIVHFGDKQAQQPFTRWLDPPPQVFLVLHQLRIDPYNAISEFCDPRQAFDSARYF